MDVNQHPEVNPACKALCDGPGPQPRNLRQTHRPRPPHNERVFAKISGTAEADTAPRQLTAQLPAQRRRDEADCDPRHPEEHGPLCK